MGLTGRWYDEKARCEVVSAEVHDRLSHESVANVDFWRDEALEAEQQLKGAVEALQRIAAIDPSDVNIITPQAFRLSNAVAIARSALNHLRGQ